MAKMKIYELAKELDKPSKDIITLLTDKGYEAKSHNSNIEGDAIEMVKKALSGKENVPASEPVQKTEQVQEGTASDAEPHKKKKSIIFVSNPHNSKMTGQQSASRQGGNSGSGQYNKPNYEKTESAPVRTGLIKPTTPPTATMKPSAPSEVKLAPNPDKNPVRTEGTAVVEKVESVQQERPVSPATSALTGGYVNRNQSGDRPAGGGYANRNQSGDRPAGGGYVNRNQSGDRPAGGYVNRNQSGDRPAGGGYANRNQSGDRPAGGYVNRNQSGDRPAGGGYVNRNQSGDRPAGGGYVNRNQSGDRPAGGGYANRNQSGDRPAGGGYANRSQGQNGPRRDGGRPYDNNGRPGSGDNRTGAGARRPQGGNSFMPDSPIKETEKHRDDEKRRINQTADKDKRSKKDLIYEEDKSLVKNSAGKFIKPEKKADAAEEVIKTVVLPDVVTLKELADKMKIQPSAIVKKLFLQGKIVTVNQEISFETAEEIAIEYDVICEHEVKIDVIEELLKEEEEDKDKMVSRPPVICVMGHVDHGKTSLLDAIRKTNVTDREAGGITQHIGAYTVNLKGQKITFLDTPGHEAFTAMRMRGANATDIAILVVAADDGVMPQTVEAISHAKAAGIEIIVAVNKIDKPNANMDRVKQELSEYELVPEDWGGSTIFVPVSAKVGTGIEQLLEMILLSAELLELKANPSRRARGLVIEAELDKGRGPVATVLVQKGTLCVGDFISAGAANGKVRAMIDDKGKSVREAGPSKPVEILGLSDVPEAGDVFIAHNSDKEAKYFAETFVAQNKVKKIEETKTKMSLDDLFSQIQAGNLKELNLIIKADVQGSVEAVKQSLGKLSNEEVVVKCIHGGVGAINESDVILASASKAIIIGFNVRPDVTAKNTAEREGVDVRLYKVIYQAIEDVEAAMKGMLDPVFEEKVIGHAEVRQIFKASAVGNISGSYVLDGKFERKCKVRITREGELIYEGVLESLKRFKDDVKEVKAGFECGLVFDGFDQVRELDIVEAYIMVEVPR